MLTKFFRSLHKFLGMPLALIFVIWFLSGMVMVFAPGFPRAPRTSPSSTALKGNWIPLDSLVTNALGEDCNPTSVIFAGKNGHDLVTISAADTSVVLDAVTGVAYAPPKLTPDEVAKKYCNAPINRIDTLKTVDQWIPFEHYEDMMPIYKFYFNDDGKHQLYITGNGDLIQMTDKSQRIKAWFGTIPHWLYFTVLRKHQKAWTETVIWAALLGCIMCIAGIIIAIIDWRRQARRRGIFSIPYRKKLWRWHFILGLIFGWCCITFAFSGYMSMAPLPDFLVKERTIKGQEHDKPAQRGERQMRRRNNARNSMAQLDKYALLPSDLITSSDSILAIAFKSWEGHPYYTVTYPSLTRHIDATDANDVHDFVLSTELIEKKAAKAFPDLTPKITLISEYDSEYFSRTGRMTPLPAIRVEYIGDELHTVEYYDPKGLGVRTFDDNSRMHSLLYGKLHRLSFKCLTDHLWLWYTVMFLLLAGGSALSITGFIMTFQWISRKLHISRRSKKNKIHTLK